MAGSEVDNPEDDQKMIDRMILLISTLAFFLGVVMLTTGQAVALAPLFIGVLGFVSLKIDEGKAANVIGSPTDSSVDEDQEALDALRSRYAHGELTKEQFEQKLEHLLETDTLENATEWQENDREAIKE